MFILGVVVLFIAGMYLIWKSKFKEFWAIPILTSVIFSIVVITSYMQAKESKGGDTMVLNGYVTKKYSERTSCSHTYSCNCRVVMNGKSTSTKCDTCHEHAYDVDWIVKSNVGAVEIDRINRQGTKETPRFTKAYVGEPFSIEKSYYNYIKASPLSVFKDFGTYKNIDIPTYPKVYD